MLCMYIFNKLLSDPNLDAMRLPDLLDGSSSVTNVTLACGDGSLASHKILVAGVSSFIKNILADIPIGDDVTLILPDFTEAEVDMFLKSVTLKEETENKGRITLFNWRNENVYSGGRKITR